MAIGFSRTARETTRNIGGNTNADTLDLAGNTALIRAVIRNRTVVVRKIARAHPDQLNAQGWHGNTALHFAVLLKRLSMIHALLAAPAIDRGIANDSGRTALALAREHHHRDVERVFRLAAMKAQRRGSPVRANKPAGVRTRRVAYHAPRRTL